MNSRIKTTHGSILLAGTLLLALFLISHSKAELSRITAFVPASTQTAAAGDVTSGLVAHWTFDGNANDSAGNNNGTVVGNPEYVEGKIGQAINLNGTNGYINLPANSNSLNITGPFTISTWVKPTINVTTMYGIMSKGQINSGQSSGQYNLSTWVDGRFMARVFGANGYLMVTAPGTPQANTWYHLVTTWDGTTLSLYKDGNLVSSTASSTFGPLQQVAVTRGVAIGWDHYGTSHFWNGDIDDVRIYDRALNETQVGQLYADNNVQNTSDMVISADSNTNADLVNTNNIQNLTQQNNHQTQLDQLDSSNQMSNINESVQSGICAPHTYYIDYDNGDDNNTGTCTGTPWKHAPGDINATGLPLRTKFQAGDTLIFKGGVVYRGGLTFTYRTTGTSGHPITFDGNTAGTFGTGPAIFDGATPVEPAWTKCSSAAACGGNPNYSHIYYADAPANFTSFQQGAFEDSNFMWYAQSPYLDDPFYWDVATNWHVIPKGSKTITETNSTITDPSVFTQSDPNYWVGSYIGIWVNPNVTIVKKITGYDPSTHTVAFEALTEPNTPYPHDTRDNYYSLLNNINILNQAGHYYLDEENHRVYVWPINSDSPVNHKYSFGSSNIAIAIHCYASPCNYITVQGFIIQHYINGIHVDDVGGTGLIIRNNTIRNLISNDNYAIDLRGVMNTLVDNNRITNGMRSVGIVFSGQHITVQNNYVSRTSRQGIWCLGGSAGDNNMSDIRIINNTVTDINGQHSNAISTYYCNDALIAENYISNSTNLITWKGSRDLTIYGNVADGVEKDTGVHSWGGMTGTVNIINNTFVRVDIANVSGGALNASSGDTALYNTINNIIDGGSIGMHDYNIYNRYNWSQRTPSMWTSGAYEVLIPDITAIFINSSAGDFHLRSDSSAIAAGINPTKYLPIARFAGFDFFTDLDGHSRPASGAWDLGAYQYCASVCVSDYLNNNGATGEISDIIIHDSNNKKDTSSGGTGAVYSNTRGSSGGGSVDISKINNLSLFTFTRYLTIGSTGSDVKILQQTLNSLGYTVSVSGAGSPGQETTYYGPATTAALQKFQCAVLKICSGSPATNGYGNFGPQTRNALNTRIAGNMSQVTSGTGTSGTAASSVPPATFSPVTPSVTLWLTLGTDNIQVKTLQQLLNSRGYTVATTGPGSPGQETTYFGNLTEAAVKRFQCATLQVCSGTPATTGYGATGPRTRAGLK